MRTEETTGRNSTTAKPRRRVARAIALLALAVVAALGTAFLLTRYMDARTAATRVPTIKVVAAAVDIPVAAPIKAEWLAVVDWPAASRPDGAEQVVSGLVDRVALVPIAKGEPVLAAKLAQAGARGGLAALVPDGMRAAAVRVDDVVGVAGFIHPGDRVDVIVTMQSRTTSEATAKVILQNVKVLAVGREVQNKAKDTQKSLPATVATLMVTPDESESLALAATKGKLLLTLRGISDEVLAETSGATPAVLLGAPRPAAETHQPVRTAVASTKHARKATIQRATASAQSVATPKQSVEILRGDLFEKRDFNKTETR